MKRVFLTGATGVMGFHGLKELTVHPDKYEVMVLARDSKKNRRKLAPFISKGVNVIWGDLLDKEAVKKGVDNADIVLHVGGMVPVWRKDTHHRRSDSMSNLSDSVLEYA